jgi:peptide/nickel transport system substrate-binding protein
VSSKALAIKLSGVCLVLSMVATGCIKERTTTTTTTTITPGGTQSTTANPSPTSSLATPVNPTAPSPYGEVTVEDVEMRQGRYPQGEFGGTLVQSIIASDPKTFNAWSSNDSTSSKLAGLMWGGLLGTDPFNGDVITDMAKSYEVKPDHVTYITHLRKGLKWSDGQPITAEDVAFTFNTLVAGGYGNASLKDVVSVAGQPPKVTVIDELTNQFVTAKPFAPFLRTAGSIPIAPKHTIEPIIKGKDGRAKFQQLWSPSGIDPKKIVTSGPFVLDRFTPSQRVEFVRAKNYYVADPGGKRLPYLDRLVYLFVPDVNTNLLKFKGGEIETTQVRNKDAVDLQKVTDRGNFKLYNLGQDSGSTFLMFNMNRRNNKAGKPYVTPYKSAWFNDANFRQAISHAINRQLIVDGYLRGIGVPTFTGETSSSPWFNNSLQPITQDLKYSQDLLAKSGFVKKPDGYLYDKAGHKVEFDMLAGAGGTFMQAVAGYVGDDLKKLGIKANYQEVEFNSLINKIDGSKDWEACLFGLTGDPMEPNNGTNVFRSDGRLHLFDIRDQNEAGKTVVSDARPWETQIDDLFTKGAEEFDTAKRKQLYADADKILYDQAPFIYLCSPMDIVATRNTIRNYVPTQMAVSQQTYGLHNLDEIYKGK